MGVPELEVAVALVIFMGKTRIVARLKLARRRAI
jgi:hypothetical protein